MATLDQMIIDDRELAKRYFGEDHINELDNDQYLFSNPTTNIHQRLNSNDPLSETPSNKYDDNIDLYGRRVFLESPALGNKDEEDLYRFVPSRLSDHTGALATSGPASSGDVLIDSLDLELDLIGATNANHRLPFQPNTLFLSDSKPPAPLTQLPKPVIPSTVTNIQRADPRQDPLLGPLLAELDAMTAQQQRLPDVSTNGAYRRNSIPYDINLTRPSGLLQPNYGLTNPTNHTLNNAVLEAELYDSLNVRDQQLPSIQQRPPLPFSAPHLNQSNHPSQNQPRQQQPIQKQKQQQQQQQQKQEPQHQAKQQQQLPARASKMNSTDLFIPSSYDNGPSFLSHFGPDDQLFQQPLFNPIGQNYVPNTRPPPPQRDQLDPSSDNSYSRGNQSRHTTYGAPQQSSNNVNQPRTQIPSFNQQPPYDNADDDPFSEYHDMFSSSQYQRQPPAPSQQQRPYERTPRSNNDLNNQEVFFTDNIDDQLDQYSYRQQTTGRTNNQHNPDDRQDQDSKRQAIWNELQRTNAKVQEKNAKKRESANRRDQLLKGIYPPNNATNNNGAQHPSAPGKTGGNSPPQRRPLPAPIPKANYIEENIDMIKNKENFYHRYPAKKYENLYAKRKDLTGTNNGKKNESNQNQDNTTFDQHTSDTYQDTTTATYSETQQRSSLPVTINLNPGDKTQTGSLPASVTIPLDSHVTRAGDKISVNIDLRLVDLQNLKQKNEHPDWSGLDPLDRHIRKLERSVDEKSKQVFMKNKHIECRWINCCCQRRQQKSLPSTQSNPAMSTSMGRYGKMTTGGSFGAYSSPNHKAEYGSYTNKLRDETSYLSKMYHVKEGPHFKPYTGKDYEKFKKNNGLGTGFLGFDFDNPTYKEKSDKLFKTKEYAQQVEARNKKALSEAPRRTLSDTRIPTEVSKTQRALDYARVSTRHKPPSGASIRSTPPDPHEINPHRRPTEAPNRPPATHKQPIRSAPNDDSELVERLAQRHEREKAQVHGILNPSQKRRDQIFDYDDRRASDIERLAQDRANQRRLSPPKQFPSQPGSSTNGNARKPIRFDGQRGPDESPHSTSQSHQRSPASQVPPYQQNQQNQQNQQPLPRPRSTHQPQYPVHSVPMRTVPHSNVPHSNAPHQSSQPQYHEQTNIDELATRHNDEKMLMEAIRQELSERPLGDDEELIVVEQ